MMTGVTESVVLLAGLPAFEVDERLRKAHRRGDATRRELAFYLADMADRGLQQELGYPTAIAYAQRALGMARRTARELLRCGQRLRELSAIDRAFARGSVTWSNVRVLCRMATPDTEAEWLEKALHLSQEELERLARGARPGDRPRKDGLPKTTFRPAIELDAYGWELWNAARDKLRAESGVGPEVTDSEVALEMVRLVLQSDPDGSVPGRKAVVTPPVKIVVAGDGTAAVLTEEGLEPLDESTAERVTEGAKVSRSLKGKMLDRDGHRCQHCWNRRGLHPHHVQWSSRGGRTVLRNLVTLCSRCHGLVHDGFIEVEVARCATSGRVRFVFYDAAGRRLDRRVLCGPFVEIPPPPKAS